ncbi:MAG: leucine-rich repeat protein [Muribaculaceae bacterium]|nr:leucine-rich repeat protein [Muribaculaceae bacterium]
MKRFLLVIAIMFCYFGARAVSYNCDFYTDDGLGYKITGAGTVTLQDACGPDEDDLPIITDLVVPETVNFGNNTYTVTGIGSFIFVPCLLTCENQDYTYTPLKSVTIPNTVTHIDGYAFVDCISLETVKLGEGIEKIEAAFMGCSSLKKIYLPKSLKNISSQAFIATAIEAYEIDSENPYLTVVDGVLYDKAITKLISYPTAKAGSYTIPQSVTTLCEWAFYGCNKLTNLTIGDQVTSIGECLLEFSSVEHVTLPNTMKVVPFAFCSGCANLKSIEFPESVTTIDGEAFCECTSLTSVTLGENVSTINAHAFTGCSSLREITLSAQNIDSYAFLNCNNLEHIHFGKSARSITLDWFNRCKTLKNITIDPENPYYKIDGPGLISTADNKFVGVLDRSAKYITIPEGVTEICSYAFLLASEMQLIYIPKTVTHLGNYIFQNLPPNVAIFNDALKLQSTESNTFTNKPSKLVMYLHGDPYYVANHGEGIYSWKCNTTQFVKSGDINGDHFIDISDINKLIDLILTESEIKGDQIFDYPDMNHDGSIGVGDFNMMIDYIANPSHTLFYEPFEQEKGPSGCSWGWFYPTKVTEVYGSTTDNPPYFSMLTYDDGTPAKKGICLGGDPSIPGKVSFRSENFSTNRITFKYGDPYNNNNYSFKVEIRDNRGVYNTFVLNGDSKPGVKTFTCDYQTFNPAEVLVTMLSTDPNSHVAIWDVKMYK